MKLRFVLIGLGILTFSLSSCNDGGVSSSSFSQGIDGPTEIEVGEVVKYSYPYSENISWASSNPSVLEISSNGEAIAFKEGNVTISVLDEEEKVLATLDVSVENKVNIPSTSLEIANLFSISTELEQEVVFSKLEITDTYIDQVKVQEAHMFKNYYTIEIADSYKNYAGEFDERYTEYKGIKDGYYYDLSLKDEASYAIKRKVVDSNQTDYEILRSEAENRLTSPRFVNAFYYKLAEMWGARTLDLKVEEKESQNGFTLELENTYLFEWANGVDNDSKHYEAILNFSNDGFFLDGEFKEIVYEQTQYDVSTSSWVEDAKIAREYTIKYSCSRGQKEIGEQTIDPTDYFVQSVTSATYEPINPLTVGGRINSDFIVLKEYEKPSAIDINNILIVDVKNDESKIVVVKDEVNGGYVAVATGTCYLVCRMMYSSEVTFLVEVTVL